MVGDRDGQAVAAPGPCSYDEHSVPCAQWAAARTPHGSHGVVHSAHREFKTGHVPFKMLRATKYDNHLMYENYSQPKTDSLEIAGMTSFRQNCPNLFLIYTVHIINFYNMTRKTNLIKVPNLLLHKRPMALRCLE